MADKDKKPEGRVIAGGGRNIFKSVEGGRSDYGGLILSALTGKSHEELVEDMAKSLTGPDADLYRKELATAGQVDATLLDAEDQFFLDYLRVSGGPSLLAPPIAPERLERLVAENNTLEPCIAAMTTNISMTGMEIVPVEGNEAELTDEEKEERKGLWDFFKEPAPRKSFTRIRKELRRDLHSTGNSYLVVERTMNGDIAFIRRAPAKSMRMIKLDKAVPVTVKMRRNGQDVEIQTVRAERRFVQKIGTRLVYYKEYGSQRDLHRVTGEWARDDQTLRPQDRAHEIIHDKDIEDVKTPYGMPRWITQLPSVLGSRMAEEHNLAFFQSGGVPPVIVFISGGMVSERVADALNKYLGGTSKDKQRGIAVEVPSSGDIQSERPANVSVERFGSQEQDSTFENYDEKNELRVRQAFRLPGIFLGKADSYNFSCYDSKTEALTDKGWIRHDQFKPGMKVACFNPETQGLEYHEPEAGIQTYEVTDVPMYHFNGHVDIMVTPRHRMHYETPKGVRRTEPVETMLERCSRPSFVRRIEAFEGGDTLPTFTPPHVPSGVTSTLAVEADYPPVLDGSDWLELVGWVISDGHVMEQEGAISITQGVDRGWASIKALLQRLEEQGLSVWWPKKEEGIVTVYFNDRSLYWWIKTKVGTRSHNKRIPRELLSLDRAHSRVLFDALMAGDGSWDTRPNRTTGYYATVSKGLADDIQELALRLGYHARVTDVPAGSLSIRPGYRVHIGKGGSRGADGRTQTVRSHTRVSYTGTVWCFTVPTGVFVTRRNGVVAIQGNTAHASYVVAEAQVFAPERDEEDERYNMTIMREVDPTGKWKIVSNPLSVQDVNIQLKALSMLAATPGVSVSDIVKNLSQVSGLEIKIHEDYEEAIVGEPGPLPELGGGNPTQTPSEPPTDDDDDDDAPPSPAADTTPTPPEPGVTAASKRQAHILAAQIARTIRDFEDTRDYAYVATLLQCEDQYDDMTPGVQEIVNSALAPVMFNSPFLNDAAMADLSAGYAKAAFNAARSAKEPVQ